MKKLLALTMLVTYFLCGCGGSGPGGGPLNPKLRTAFINPTDAVIPVTGYDLQIMVYPDPNPVTSVAYQANNQPGNLIAWPGPTRITGFGGWTAFLDEVVKYPQFKYVYLYDELGLAPGGGISLADQAAVLAASAEARARGLKTMTIYFPDAVLSPGFSLGIPNGIDIIGLDIYPNIMPTNPVPNIFPGNPYKNVLLECIIRLRAQGFTGEIWYVYQAFDITTNDPVWFQAQLVLQKEAIDDAQELGASGIVPWGMYLGAAEIANEPNLVPLENTEPLVVPAGTTVPP